MATRAFTATSSGGNATVLWPTGIITFPSGAGMFINTLYLAEPGSTGITVTDYATGADILFVVNGTRATLTETSLLLGSGTDLKLSGSTSGASTLKAPAIASTYVHTLPAATCTLIGSTDFGSGMAAYVLDPTNPVNVLISEEFCGGQAADLALGENAWRCYSDTTGGTFARGTGSGSASGVFTATASATINYGATIILNALEVLDDMGSSGSGSWESSFRFKVDNITDAKFVVGWVDGVGSYGGQFTCDKIAITYLAGTDTTLKLTTRSAGAETKVDTTVTPANDTYYTAKIWSTAAGTIKARIYSATGAALGSEVTSSTNVPNTAMCPEFYVGNTAATSHVITCDSFRVRATVSR